MVKVNFDTSWKEVEAGAGFIIKNHDGHVLGDGARHIRANFVPEAELRAAWKGNL